MTINTFIIVFAIANFPALSTQQNPIVPADSPLLPILREEINTWRWQSLIDIAIATVIGLTIYIWIALIIREIGKTAASIAEGNLRIPPTDTFIKELQTLEGSLTQIARQLQANSATENKANYIKSSLIADMSHELRSPLNAILGFAQIMQQESSLTRSQLENMAIINRSGKRLLTIVNDVVDLSKIETNRLTLERDLCDFSFWIDNLERSVKTRADYQNLEFLLIKDSDLPRYIYLDERRLRQVVQNLVDYILRHTISGKVKVKIYSNYDSSQTQKQNPERLELNFAIESNNFSLKSEELNSLFEPRARISQEWKSPDNSSLSLPISFQLARLMGGDIEIFSNYDLPSGIVLHLRVAAEIGSDRDSAIPATPKKIIGLAAEQPEYRILVVDDSKTNRKIMLQLLEPIGFKVREAVNGKEAIDIWLCWQPHMIWMDIRMPVMNGIDATEQIKSSTKTASPPIVALTASTLEEERSLFQAAGCDDFVGKPFSEDIIFDKIAQHLGVRYTYESISTEISQSQQLTAKDLSGMSDRWLTEVEEAAITLDKELLTQLIQEISEEREDLRRALQQLTDTFDFEKILNLVRQDRDK